MYEKIKGNNLMEPLGAYSNGLIIPIAEKKLILLTGQIATNEKGNVVFENDISKQTRYIFENIRNLLSEVNAGFEDIIKVVIYITNIDKFQEVSKIRNEYLKISEPVSTLVEVNNLAVKGCEIEIEITAII